MLKHCEEVQEVSIIPRGNAGGYTMTRPENDDMTLSFNKANDEIAMCMGGRLAEEIVLKDITSGASHKFDDCFSLFASNNQINFFLIDCFSCKQKFCHILFGTLYWQKQCNEKIFGKQS